MVHYDRKSAHGRYFISEILIIDPIQSQQKIRLSPVRHNLRRATTRNQLSPYARTGCAHDDPDACGNLEILLERSGKKAEAKIAKEKERQLLIKECLADTKQLYYGDEACLYL